MRHPLNTPYRDSVATDLRHAMSTNEKLRRARKALWMAVALDILYAAALVWLVVRLRAAGGTLW